MFFRFLNTTIFFLQNNRKIYWTKIILGLKYIAWGTQRLGEKTSRIVCFNVKKDSKYICQYFVAICEPAVCEKCGAIGVKHAFYTKERRFCSRACARSSEHAAPTADSTYSPSHTVESATQANRPSSPIETKPTVDNVNRFVAAFDRCIFKLLY